jgi:hypothetical protein
MAEYDINGVEPQFTTRVEGLWRYAGIAQVTIEQSIKMTNDEFIKGYLEKQLEKLKKLEKQIWEMEER